MEQQKMNNIFKELKLNVSTKAKVAIAAGTVCALLTVGTTAAYLTDNTSITSTFLLNTDLRIELEEPHFFEADAEGLVPTQTVSKDPTVINTGSVPVYVMAKVKVPVFEGSVLTPRGVVEHVSDQDLFSFALNPEWMQVGAPIVADGYRIYDVVYEHILEESDTSQAVFDEVTVANLTEAISISDTKIDVNAYAIQAQGFDSAHDAWSGYMAQDQAIRASQA